MARLSRWMPQLIRPTTGPLGYLVLALIGAGLLAAVIFSKEGRVILSGLVLVGAMIHVWDTRRLRLLARSREGENLCTFARAFDRRETNFWAVRAVYDELRPYCSFRGGRLPLRLSDSLTKDLRIDGDDLDDIARDATLRVGRSCENLEANPKYGSVHTVGDLVAFVQHQPQVSPPAA